MTWGTIGKAFIAEQARHEKAFGDKSGLRFITCKVFDTPVPDNFDFGGAACFVLHAGVRSAFLAGFGVPTITNETIEDTTGFTFSEGLTEDAEKELVHKILAAAGIIPYQKGNERYWIRWNGDEPRIEPAE